MTMLRGELIAFLKDGLQGTIGVYPVRAPIEAVYPLVTVAYVSDYSEHVHTGPDGLIRRRIQLDIWSEDHDTTDELAEQVQRLLDGYRGPLGDSVTVGSCMKDNEFDADDTTTRLWRRIQDYQVAYNEMAGS